MYYETFKDKIVSTGKCGKIVMFIYNNIHS